MALILPEGYDVYIFKYTQLVKWVDVFNMGILKSATFDEVQELRRNSSEKYDSAKVLCNSVEYCLGLSATPIYNFGEEIYNIMNVLKPGCLGLRGEFETEWTGYGKAVKDPKALGSYLRDGGLFLRRTRADVGMQLPKVNTIIEYVDYDHETVKKGEELARLLSIKVTQGNFMERGKASRELDIMARMYTGLSKAKQIAEFVKILLDNGEPVLLAGWHREVYEIWLEELKDYKPVMYTGSESPLQKQKSRQAFIDGDTDLMIMSLRSGIGVDALQTRCSIVVIGELDWSPKVHEQLIARIDRPGQTKPVTAFYLVSDSMSDPLMIDLLGLKNSQSSGIIDPLIGVQQQYTDESRIKLLAESFLKKHHTETA